MRYLVAVHHPDTYDPAIAEDDARRGAIDHLNEEMKAAGVRSFVGGLRPARSATSLQLSGDGQVTIADGPYLKTTEHIGGFWVLEVQSVEDALEWGRKAAIACRAPIEVRAFH